MELADLYAARRANLARLIDGPRFGGVRSAFARHIERQPSQVSQWLSGHRSITEESRDHIEIKCELPRGSLDAGTGALHRPKPAPDISAAVVIEGLARLINDIDALQRDQIARRLEVLAHAPDSKQARDALAAVLATPPSKRTGTR